MNPIQEAIPWSKRRWFWTVLAIFSLHLALIWNFSESPSQASSQSVLVSSVRLLNRTSDPAREWFDLTDPTLFALTSPKGFSGTAWLRLEPFPYRLTNQIEPNFWLAGQSIPLAQNVSALIEAGRTGKLLGAEKPPPASWAIRVPAKKTVVRAALRFEGDLTARTLISTDPLPEAEDDTVLAHCVVSATVNGAGDVVSHVPISSSGSPPMDAKAINFVKAARFAAVSDGTTLSIGTFVFQWNAVTLTETKSGER